MIEGVEDHFRAAIQCCLTVFWLDQIAEVIDMLRPDLFRVESAIVVQIFFDVSDDVCFLEEKAHRVMDWPECPRRLQSPAKHDRA